MGRIRSEKEQTGVSIKVEESGVMTHPPADREYAVEPVGVDTMSPSAEKSPALLPSIATRILAIRLREVSVTGCRSASSLRQ